MCNKCHQLNNLSKFHGDRIKNTSAIEDLVLMDELDSDERVYNSRMHSSVAFLVLYSDSLSSLRVPL